MSKKYVIKSRKHHLYNTPVFSYRTLNLINGEYSDIEISSFETEEAFIAALDDANKIWISLSKKDNTTVTSIFWPIYVLSD